MSDYGWKDHRTEFASNVVYIDPAGVEGLLAYIARWKAARVFARGPK